MLCQLWAGPQAQGIAASEQLWGHHPKQEQKHSWISRSLFRSSLGWVKLILLILPWAGFKLPSPACSVGCAKLRSSPGKSRQSPAEQDVTMTAEPAHTCRQRGWAWPAQSSRVHGTPEPQEDPQKSVPQNSGASPTLNQSTQLLGCLALKRSPLPPFLRAQTCIRSQLKFQNIFHASL